MEVISLDELLKANKLIAALIAAVGGLLTWVWWLARQITMYQLHKAETDKAIARLEKQIKTLREERQIDRDKDNDRFTQLQIMMSQVSTKMDSLTDHIDRSATEVSQIRQHLLSNRDD